MEARKPIPLERPAPRPVPVSISTFASVAAAAKDDKGAGPEAPTSTDWGLAPKKRPLVTKLKALVALGALAASVGGYFGFNRYYSKETLGVAEVADAGNLTDSDAPRQSNSALDGQESDPFDDSLKSGIDQDPQAIASSEPRKMRLVPDAAPIALSRRANGRSPKKPPRNTLSLDDEPLDVDDDSDDSAPPRLTQSEPDFDGDATSGPALDGSAGAPRRNGAGGHAASRSQNAANRAREFSGGPRISSNQTRDSDLADELSDDKIDGYNVAKHKHGKTAQGSAANPRISVIAVRDDGESDERFDGYTPENPNTKRAVSKTKVIRPTEATGRLPPAAGIDGTGSRRHASARSTLADDDDFPDEAPPAPGMGRGTHDARIDDDRDFNRPARDGMTAIQRRGSPPLPSAGSEFRARRHPTDADSQNLDPASDIYRVVPEDTFWKISRKQYGTARYFQALSRHNQDRVPDPQKLKPGTQISTPSVALLEKRYPDLIEKAPPGAATSGLAEHKGTRPRFEKPVSELASERAFDGVPVRRTDAESSAGYFYSKAGDPMYRVGSDDTLTGIAQRHLGRASRWTEIYDQNRDILKSPNDLTLGTIIRLPGDASRLSLVPETERRR